MANNYNNNDADSLARSHSKSSNAKLTLLCFFAILALSAAIITVALYFKLETMMLLFVSIGCVLLFILSCIGFSKFTR